MNETIYIGIGSQKGGVGKSTISEMLSGILYYEYDYTLLVIDCDTTQNSFLKHRERDRHFIENSTGGITQQLLTRFQKYNKPAYPVINAEAGEAIDKADALREKQHFDIVLFDMPGRCDTPELLQLSISMDYIISPIEPDIQSLAACLTYGSTVMGAGIKIPEARIREVYMLWNKVDRRVRTDTMNRYGGVMQKMDLKVLDSKLYFSKRYSNELAGAKDIQEVFRCTYLAPTPAQRAGLGISELVEELINKIIQGVKEN